MLAVQEVVRRNVDLTFPEHGANEGGVDSENGATPDAGGPADSVRNYAQEVLSLGLLLIEFINAIREGDGSSILRCW